MKELEISRKKRIKFPKSTEKQMKRQKRCLNKLSRGLLKPTGNIDIVMDDESYFTVDGSDTKFNNTYLLHSSVPVPNSIKFNPKTKYPLKVMVWLAISPKGFSQPYIIKSGNAVNSVVYQKRCLEKLKRFLEQNYPDQDYVFWPDLARAHYSKSTQDYYRANGIKFIPEKDNPPNVPQLRPIEQFWSYLGQKIYSNGWTTDKIPSLTRRINKIIKITPIEFYQKLMRNVKTKIRRAVDRRPLAIIDKNYKKG